MHKVNIALLCLMLSASSSAVAQNFANDSVINPALRGRSIFSLERQNVADVSLLHSVPLGSQSNEDIFVDYGTFTNESPSTMKISLTSKGMSGRRTLVAGVVGGDRYEGSESLTFLVPSKHSFAFSIKDFAEISVSIQQVLIDGGLTGIPSAKEFMFPTGKYIGCTDYFSSDPDGVHTLTGTMYFYEAGSMSDKSVRKNYLNQLNPKVTTGDKPAQPGLCVQEGL
jgi:hypothetical protein